jgi:hypothetical protein
MRHSIGAFAAAASLIVMAGLPAAAAECSYPQGAMPTVPDGRTATAAQLSAAFTAVQSYVNLLQSFQDCVEARIKLAPAGSKAEDLQKLREQGDDAIERAETLKNEYGAQVAAFKATGKAPPSR